jgi:hypothetical protein
MRSHVPLHRNSCAAARQTERFLNRQPAIHRLLATRAEQSTRNGEMCSLPMGDAAENAGAMTAWLGVTEECP